MIEALTMNELLHLCKWFKAIKGDSATLGDLQKYIVFNKITNKTRLLNKLHSEFVKLENK